MAKAKKPAAKAAVPKFRPDQCHYGAGSYGSTPGSPRCQQIRDRKRQLCAEHEALWKVEAKRRAQARRGEATKPAAKAKPQANATTSRVVPVRRVPPAHQGAIAPTHQAEASIAAFAAPAIVKRIPTF